MTTKPEQFHQATPHDQLIVMLMAIEGHVMNMEDGVSSLEVDLPKIHELIKQTKLLLPFIKSATWKDNHDAAKRTRIR